MIKLLQLRLSALDADAIGSLYMELSKIPHTIVSFSKDHNKMLITCREENVVRIKKVVARYV